MTWLLVAVGGAAGSVLRFAVGRWAGSHWGPDTVMGTLIVNVTGSFVIGLLVGISLERAPLPEPVRSFAAVGFLGGYTTFSTLSLESVRLIMEGEFVRAAANVGGSIIAGLGAAFLGLLMGNVAARAWW